MSKMEAVLMTRHPPENLPEGMIFLGDLVVEKGEQVLLSAVLVIDADNNLRIQGEGANWETGVSCFEELPVTFHLAPGWKRRIKEHLR